MKNLLFLFFALAIVSCSDNTLDLNNAQFYDIEDVLKSDNCSSDCDDMADCEGQEVKLVGIIDEANINANQHTFFMLDENDELVSMEVRVDELISPAVFSKIAGNGGEVVRAEGLLGGYKDSTTVNCERVIFLNVNDPSTVRVEL